MESRYIVQTAIPAVAAMVQTAMTLPEAIAKMMDNQKLNLVCHVFDNLEQRRLTEEEVLDAIKGLRASDK